MATLLRCSNEAPDQSRHLLRYYLSIAAVTECAQRWRTLEMSQRHNESWVFMEKSWLRVGGEKYCAADTWRPSAVWSCLTWKMYTSLIYSYASPVIFVSSSTWTGRPDIGISFSVINVKAAHWPWHTQLLYVSVLYWCICRTKLLLISAFRFVYLCSDVVFSISALVQKELRKVSVFVAGKFTQNLEILFW